MFVRAGVVIILNETSNHHGLVSLDRKLEDEERTYVRVLSLNKSSENKRLINLVSSEIRS